MEDVSTIRCTCTICPVIVGPSYHKQLQHPNPGTANSFLLCFLLISLRACFSFEFLEVERKVVLIGGYGPKPYTTPEDCYDRRTGEYVDIFNRYSEIYEATLPWH